MKKRLIMLIIVVISVISIFAGELDERVWFHNDGGSFNITSIDLSKTFYCPRYSTKYSQISHDPGDPEKGTYSKLSNGIGNIGMAFCNHEITFTITTDGRFTSTSDPTKYRSYYLALKPKYRLIGESDDSDYYYDNQGNLISDLSARVPNTKNTNTLTAVFPAHDQQYDGNKKKLNYGYVHNFGDIPETAQIMRFFWDLCICMDDITPEEMSHLTDSNDYLTTISISWTCSEGASCTNPKHNGSYIVAFPGYYNVAARTSDVYLVVTPEADSMDLNLMSIATTDKQIAAVKLYSQTKSKNWANDIQFFVSSSSAWNTEPESEFKLVNNDRGYYINYTVKIRNDYVLPKNESKRTTEFDGTDYYNKEGGKRVILSDALETISNKKGDSSKAILYTGNVYINVDKVAYIDLYNEQNELTHTYGFDFINEVKTDPDNDHLTHNISGIYTSVIYYHVVYI